MSTVILVDRDGRIQIKGKCGLIFEGDCKIKKDKSGGKMALELQCDLKKINPPKIMKNPAPAPPKPHPKLSNPRCPINSAILRNIKRKRIVKSDEDIVNILLNR